MNFYTIAEFKARASKIVDVAKENNEEALLTRHGKPVALIVPVSEKDIAWSRQDTIRKRLEVAQDERARGKIISPAKTTHAKKSSSR